MTVLRVSAAQTRMFLDRESPQQQKETLLGQFLQTEKPNSSTWRLLQQVSDWSSPYSAEEMEALSQKVADLFRQVGSPEGYLPAFRDAVETLSFRSDMTVTASHLIFWACYDKVAEDMRREKRTNPRALGSTTYYYTLLDLLTPSSQSYLNDVSFWGTVMRGLTPLFPSQDVSYDAGRYLLRLNLPVEVEAYYVVANPDRVFLSHNPDRLRKRIKEGYPDLADLPEKMLLEVVASQPFPDEWFIDVHPLIQMEEGEH